MTSHIDLKELFKFYNCSMNSLVNIQIGYDGKVYILLSAHIPERIQGMFVDTKANTEYSAIRLSVDWESGEVVHHELIEFGNHNMNFHFILLLADIRLFSILSLKLFYQTDFQIYNHV